MDEDQKNEAPDNEEPQKSESKENNESDESKESEPRFRGPNYLKDITMNSDQ